MKLLLSLLVLTGCVYAQSPSQLIRRDSLPGRSAGAVDSPSVDSPDVFPPDLMPNARPKTSFYRYRTESRNVMRSTLDNMPVKMADSSTHYTMLRSFRKYVKPEEAPMQLLKPMPRIVPKKFR